jgi:hypothetical protein
MKYLIERVTISSIALASLLLISSCGSGTVKDVINVAQGGSFTGTSPAQLKLAKQSRFEMCCNITIVEYTEQRGVVNGCGVQSVYVNNQSEWKLQAQSAIADWGSAADRLPNCSQ